MSNFYMVIVTVLTAVACVAAIVAVCQSPLVETRKYQKRLAVEMAERRLPANASDVVAVWNRTNGDLRTVDPDTRESFTLDTASAYAATLDGSEIMLSRNGSPFANIAPKRRLRAAAALLHR